MINIYFNNLAHKTYTNSHPYSSVNSLSVSKLKPGCEDKNFPPQAGRFISVMLLVPR